LYSAAAMLCPPTPSSTFDVLFLGTGASNRMPRMDHVISGSCPICLDGLRPDSRNRRNNVSILVRSGRTKIMIDAGKTMYSAVTTHFPPHGLDDVRELQSHEQCFDQEGNAIGFKLASAVSAMPVISNRKTIAEAKQLFPYLAKPVEWAEGHAGVMKRKVAALNWTIIEDDTPRIPQLPHLPVRSFPVYHGGDYISLAFAFGEGISAEAQRCLPFVYISDCTGMPECSLTLLTTSRVGVLVLDALWREKHFSHYSLSEALDLVRVIQPKKTFIVGLTCYMGSHDEVNTELAQLKETENLDVSLAYDGLFLQSVSIHPGSGVC